MIVYGAFDIHKKDNIREKLDIMVIDDPVTVDIRPGEHLHRPTYYLRRLMGQLEPQVIDPVHTVPQRVDNVIDKSNIHRVHPAVAVHVNGMFQYHFHLIQIFSVHHAVVVDIRSVDDLRQIRLHFIQKDYDIVQFIQIGAGDLAVAVHVAVLEHVYQLAQPVFVFRRHPSVTVQVGDLFLIFGNFVFKVFDRLLHEQCIVGVNDTVAVDVHVSLEDPAHLLDVPVIDHAVIVHVIFGEIGDVYLPDFLSSFVYADQFLYIHLVDVAVPVHIQHMEPAHKRFLEYRFAFLEQFDVRLCYLSVAVDIRSFYLFFGQIQVQAQRMKYIQESVRVTVVNSAVMIKVLQFLQYIQKQDLIGEIHPAVTVDVRGLDLGQRNDLITFGGELEHSLDIINIRLCCANGTVHIGSRKNTEQVLEHFNIVSVDIPIQVDVRFPHVLLGEVHVNGFNDRGDILKIKPANITITVYIKRFVHHFFDGFFVFYCNNAVIIYIGPVYDRVRYFFRGYRGIVGGGLAVLSYDNITIDISLISGDDILVLCVYRFHSCHTCHVYNIPVFVRIKPDYYFLSGDTRHLYPFVYYVAVGGIDLDAGFIAIAVHDREPYNVIAAVEFYFIPRRIFVIDDQCRGAVAVVKIFRIACHWRVVDRHFHAVEETVIGEIHDPLDLIKVILVDHAIAIPGNDQA